MAPLRSDPGPGQHLLYEYLSLSVLPAALTDEQVRSSNKSDTCSWQGVSGLSERCVGPPRALQGAATRLPLGCTGD